MEQYNVYVNAVITDPIHLSVTASSEAEAKAIVAKYIRDCNDQNNTDVQSGQDTDLISIYNFGALDMGKTIQSVELA